MKPKKKNLEVYIVMGIIAYLFIILVALHCGKYLDAYPDASLVEALLGALNRLPQEPLAVFPITINGFKAIGLCTFVFAFGAMYIYIDQERNKNTLPGKESGSAKWNDNMNEYNKKYSDPKGSPDHNGDNNMIFSQDVFLNMNTFETRFNNNVLVIGGSGSGKSRFFVKPNILQANCDYVITDPAGELLENTGKFLEDQGYDIKIFNLTEMQKSLCYNPFAYVRNEEDVLTMIDCLITNTTPPNTKGGDQFWVKSETALLQALCFYLINYCPVEDRNFTNVMKLLRAAEIDENNPDKKSILDNLFEGVKKQDPNSIAYKSYMTFKMGAGKTLKSILISCAVRLTVFNLQAVTNLTSTDTIGLEEMGRSKVGKKKENNKKALFVITPQASTTYNFLVSMLYSQLFETMYYVGDTDRSSLDRQVRFLLDEFVNIGQIPQFTKKLATMRKYGISCSIIIQNLAQLKPLYEDWETIVGNCDSMIFLGGLEYSTLEYISNILGKTTIKAKNNSRTIGSKGSHSISYNSSQRCLLNPDEIGNMDNSMCIIKIRSLDPFMTKKYDYPVHPNYKYTGDADKSRKYINTLNNYKPLDVQTVSNNDDVCEEEEIRKRAAAGTIRTEIGSFTSLFNTKNAAEIFDSFRIVDVFNYEMTPEEEKQVENAIVQKVMEKTGRDKMLEYIREYKSKKTMQIMSAEKKKPVESTGSSAELSPALTTLAEAMPQALQEASSEWVFNS